MSDLEMDKNVPGAEHAFGVLNVRQGDDDLIAAALARVPENEHQRRVFEYWRFKKTDGQNPSWETIDLIDIYQSAPFIVVKDVIDGGAEFRNRFWGTGITRIVGSDQTGVMLGDYYDDKNIGPIRALYRRAVDNPQAMMFSGSMWFLPNRGHIAYNALTVVCSGDDGRVTTLATVFETAEEHND